MQSSVLGARRASAALLQRAYAQAYTSVTRSAGLHRLDVGDRRFYRSHQNPFGGGFPFGQGGDPFGQSGGSQPAADSERYYKLLDLDRSASEADIKKAYKKQAMKHHPDRGGDEATFKDISKAYSVLSDSEKRQLYDQYGEAALDNMEQGGGGGPPAGDPFELFSQIFGFGPGRGRGRNGRPRTEDAVHELTLSLEDLYAGTSRDIAYNRDVVCGDCKGEGGHSREQCAQCRGTGVRVDIMQMGPFTQQVQRPCDACGGVGSRIARGSICKTCSGKGTVREKQRFRVDVKKGSLAGTEFRFQGKADELPGHDTGDVVIIIGEKKHDIFHRVDKDLVMSKKLPLVDALCGFRFSVRHVSNQDVVIQSGPGEVVRPGEMWLVPGKGMARTDGDRYGDLHVIFKVEFPTSIAPADQQRLSQLLGGPSRPEDALTEGTAKKLSSTAQKMLEERLQAQSQDRGRGRGRNQAECVQQ